MRSESQKISDVQRAYIRYHGVVDKDGQFPSDFLLKVLMISMMSSRKRRFYRVVVALPFR